MNTHLENDVYLVDLHDINNPPRGTEMESEKVEARKNARLFRGLANAVVINSLCVSVGGASLPTTSFTPNWKGFDHLTGIIASDLGKTLQDFERQSSSPPKVSESTISLQKWEGRVLEILANSFTARLSDLTTPGIHEDAEFLMSELSPDDLPLLQPDAIFYWSIGRHTDITSRQRTVSELRLRRVPSWSAEEFEKASTEATALAIELGITNM